MNFNSVTFNELFEYDLLIDNFGFENIMIEIGVSSLIQTKKDSFGNTEKLLGALWSLIFFILNTTLVLIKNKNKCIYTN